MMKKYISIIFITLAIAGSSCKKTYLSELATNPNSPSVASPPLLLSGALKTTAAILNGSGYTQYACWMGYLSWSTSYQANVALEQYQFSTSNYDVWTPLYANLSNYNALLSAGAGANYTAIAKIMTVVDYQQLVDSYNNVPYSQALKGTLNLTPAYDTGASIYANLMVQLDAAITLIQGGGSALNPGTADVMYGGNMTSWLKFANTLKLRLALRQVNVPTAYSTAAAAATATASLGYIDTTNPAAVNPGYINSDADGGQESPLWSNYGYSQSGVATTNNQEYQANYYAINSFTNGAVVTPAAPTPPPGSTTTLSSNSLIDPRLTRVYAVNPAGNIIGSKFGGTSTFPVANITPSKLGPGVLKSAIMPAYIMSAEEALFLQAEGAARGIIPGSAATLYAAGVTASFVDDGAFYTYSYTTTTPPVAPATTPTTTTTPVTLTPAASAALYLSGPGAYPGGTFGPAQLQAIIDQKWAALFAYGAFEAYNEFRRTGYPNDIPVSIYPGVTTSTQVTRIYYPFVEYSTNSANVALQGTINPFTSKIFWAK